MHKTALPITKCYLAQIVFSAQVERACLGMPGEKRDIWPHVVTSYFIPGTRLVILQSLWEAKSLMQT